MKLITNRNKAHCAKAVLHSVALSIILTNLGHLKVTNLLVVSDLGIFILKGRFYQIITNSLAARINYSAKTFLSNFRIFQTSLWNSFAKNMSRITKIYKLNKYTKYKSR